MDDSSLKALIPRYVSEELLSRGVLLVDDEAESLEILHEFLAEDYEISFARSGAEALRVAESTPLDVVITDLRMPEMNGVELLESLRDLRPDVAGVVITAYADVPAIISAINRGGVFRYLRKPWQVEEVIDAVQQASEHVYQNRALRRLVDLLAQRSDELKLTAENLRRTQHQMIHLERLGTLGRLAAGVFHDLRDAMNGVLAIKEASAHRQLPPDLRQTLHTGLSGIESLREVLGTINGFVGDGSLPLQCEPLEVAELIDGALSVARAYHHYRAREIRVEVDDGIPLVDADRHKLVQVLVNLLRNAVDATNRHQPIHVGAFHDTASDEVVLFVEDEGPGIPAEQREEVFEPFVSSKGDKGMGMGLYMARLVIASHGGSIGCKESNNGGARFEVRLSTIPND